MYSATTFSTFRAFSKCHYKATQMFKNRSNRTESFRALKKNRIYSILHPICKFCSKTSETIIRCETKINVYNKLLNILVECRISSRFKNCFKISK